MCVIWSCGSILLSLLLLVCLLISNLFCLVAMKSREPFNQNNYGDFIFFFTFIKPFLTLLISPFHNPHTILLAFFFLIPMINSNYITSPSPFLGGGDDQLIMTTTTRDYDDQFFVPSSSSSSSLLSCHMFFNSSHHQDQIHQDQSYYHHNFMQPQQFHHDHQQEVCFNLQFVLFNLFCYYNVSLW